MACPRLGVGMFVRIRGTPDSRYTVEKIIDKGKGKGKGVPAMILVVKRHGTSGSRVAVMRY